MTISSRKITTYADNMKDVPVIPDISGTALLEKMDSRTDNEVKTLHNGLIDDLMSSTDGSSGADNIGSTALKSGGATTVQGQLEELTADKLDGGDLINAITASRTDKVPTEKAIADYAISIGAGDMLHSVYDPTGKNRDIFEYADNAVTIANNLTETTPGKALDATQGTELAKQVSVKSAADPTTSDTAYDIGRMWTNTTTGETFVRVANSGEVWRRITLEYIIGTPNGKTVLPINDKDMWLKCANLTSSLTLAQIVADATLMTTLSASSNAVDYMIRSTGTILTECVGSVNAMTKLSETGSYSMEEIIKSALWIAAVKASSNAITGMDASSKLSVTTMTNYSTPSGTVTTSNDRYSQGANAWKAFDKNNTTTWLTDAGVTAGWVTYHFTSMIFPYKMVLNHNGSSDYIKDFEVLGSVDDVSYEIIYTGTATATTELTYILDANKKYQYLKLNVKTVNSTYVRVNELQFYGK